MFRIFASLVFRPPDVEQHAPVEGLGSRDHEGVGRSSAAAGDAAGDPRPVAAFAAQSAAAAPDAVGIVGLDARPSHAAPVADLEE